MSLLWMGRDWSTCPSLNTWTVFQMNKVQMVQFDVGGGKREGSRW